MWISECIIGGAFYPTPHVNFCGNGSSILQGCLFFEFVFLFCSYGFITKLRGNYMRFSKPTNGCVDVL